MSTVVVYIYFYLGLSFSYHLSLSTLTWQNASNYCNKHCDSELVSIHNKMDHFEIQKLIELNRKYFSDNNTIWIGLYRSPINDSNFLWIDNTPFDYQVWNKNQDENELKNCVSIQTNNTSQFYIEPCNMSQYFLCILTLSLNHGVCL